MKSESDSLIEGEKSDHLQSTHKSPLEGVCRDYLRNVCKRGRRCRYIHPPQQECEKLRLGREEATFCHDFQNGTCHRPACKFLHCSREAEEVYRITGVLPGQSSWSSASINGLSLPAFSSEVLDGGPPVCKDYLNGGCHRAGVCKFRHMVVDDYERYQQQHIIQHHHQVSGYVPQAIPPTGHQIPPIGTHFAQLQSAGSTPIQVTQGFSTDSQATQATLLSLHAHQLTAAVHPISHQTTVIASQALQAPGPPSTQTNISVLAATDPQTSSSAQQLAASSVPVSAFPGHTTILSTVDPRAHHPGTILAVAPANGHAQSADAHSQPAVSVMVGTPVVSSIQPTSTPTLSIIQAQPQQVYAATAPPSTQSSVNAVAASAPVPSQQPTQTLITGTVTTPATIVSLSTIPVATGHGGLSVLRAAPTQQAQSAPQLASNATVSITSDKISQVNQLAASSASLTVASPALCPSIVTSQPTPQTGHSAANVINTMLSNSGASVTLVGSATPASAQALGAHAHLSLQSFYEAAAVSPSVAGPTPISNIFIAPAAAVTGTTASSVSVATPLVPPHSPNAMATVVTSVAPTSVTIPTCQQAMPEQSTTSTTTTAVLAAAAAAGYHLAMAEAQKKHMNTSANEDSSAKMFATSSNASSFGKFSSKLEESSGVACSSRKPSTDSLSTSSGDMDDASSDGQESGDVEFTSVHGCDCDESTASSSPENQSPITCRRRCNHHHTSGTSVNVRKSNALIGSRHHHHHHQRHKFRGLDQFPTVSAAAVVAAAAAALAARSTSASASSVDAKDLDSMARHPLDHFVLSALEGRSLRNSKKRLSSHPDILRDPTNKSLTEDTISIKSDDSSHFPYLCSTARYSNLPSSHHQTFNSRNSVSQSTPSTLTTSTTTISTAATNTAPDIASLRSDALSPETGFESSKNTSSLSSGSSSLQRCPSLVSKAVSSPSSLFSGHTRDQDSFSSISLDLPSSLPGIIEKENSLSSSPNFGISRKRAHSSISSSATSGTVKSLGQSKRSQQDLASSNSSKRVKRLKRDGANSAWPVGRILATPIASAGSKLKIDRNDEAAHKTAAAAVAAAACLGAMLSCPGSELAARSLAESLVSAPSIASTLTSAISTATTTVTSMSSSTCSPNCVVGKIASPSAAVTAATAAMASRFLSVVAGKKGTMTCRDEDEDGDDEDEDEEEQNEVGSKSYDRQVRCHRIESILKKKSSISTDCCGSSIRQSSRYPRGDNLELHGVSKDLDSDRRVVYPSAKRIRFYRSEPSYFFMNGASCKPSLERVSNISSNLDQDVGLLKFSSTDSSTQTGARLESELGRLLLNQNHFLSSRRHQKSLRRVCQNKLFGRHRHHLSDLRKADILLRHDKGKNSDPVSSHIRSRHILPPLISDESGVLNTTIPSHSSHASHDERLRDRLRTRLLQKHLSRNRGLLGKIVSASDSVIGTDKESLKEFGNHLMHLTNRCSPSTNSHRGCLMRRNEGRSKLDLFNISEKRTHTVNRETDATSQQLDSGDEHQYSPSIHSFRFRFVGREVCSDSECHISRLPSQESISRFDPSTSNGHLYLYFHKGSSRQRSLSWNEDISSPGKASPASDSPTVSPVAITMHRGEQNKRKRTEAHRLTEEQVSLFHDQQYKVTLDLADRLCSEESTRLSSPLIGLSAHKLKYKRSFLGSRNGQIIGDREKEKAILKSLKNDDRDEDIVAGSGEERDDSGDDPTMRSSDVNFDSGDSRESVHHQLVRSRREIASLRRRLDEAVRREVDLQAANEVLVRQNVRLRHTTEHAAAVARVAESAAAIVEAHHQQQQQHQIATAATPAFIVSTAPAMSVSALATAPAQPVSAASLPLPHTAYIPPGQAVTATLHPTTAHHLLTVQPAPGPSQTAQPTATLSIIDQTQSVQPQAAATFANAHHPSAPTIYPLASVSMGVLTATSHHVTVAPTSANTATVGALTHTPAQQVATLSPCQLASMPSPAPVSSSNPAGVGHASAIAVGSSACAGLISRASTDRLFNSVQAGIPPTAVSANFPTSVSVPIDAIIGHHGQHHHPGHAYNPPASGPSIHEHSTIAGIAAGSLRLISHPIAMTAAASSSGPGTPVTFALVPSSLAGPTTAFVTNCLQTPITANPLASSLHDFATRHRAHFSAETARAVPPTCIGIYGPHHSSPAAVVTSHVSAPVSLSLNAGTTITSAAGNLVYHHHPQGQTAIPHLTGHAFISPHHSLIQHHASLQEAQAALPQQLQQQHFCRQPATGAHVMVTGALIKTGHP